MSSFPLPGIDLVDVPRIAAAIAKSGDAFLRRVFTPAERAYCDQLANPAPSYAARWAAKEAVAKAFGTGIGHHAAMHEIEVLRSPDGQPSIRLHGSAAATAARLHIGSIALSLTHTDLLAAAIVILHPAPNSASAIPAGNP